MKYDVRKRHEHGPLAKAWTGSDPSWQWAVFEHRKFLSQLVGGGEAGIPRGLFVREEDARGFALLLELNEKMTEIRDANTLREIQAQDAKAKRATKVREIIADQVGAPVEEVTDDKHIMEDLGADSLVVVELILEFEEAFEIEIPDDIVETIPTVGKIIGYIEEQRQ